MKIRDLPQQEKPRERLFNYGVEALSMHELLEIIFAQGSKISSVIEIADQLTSKYPTWQKMAAAGPLELSETPGVGKAKAAQLKAAFELGRRFSAEQVDKGVEIINSAAAFNLCRTFLKDKMKEHLMLFALDIRCRLIAPPETISVGILDCSVLHPREIFGAAIRKSAASILIAHNHPSGSPEPSDADLAVTRQLFQSGQILALPLVDHLVVAGNFYTSIRERNPELFKP